MNFEQIPTSKKQETQEEKDKKIEEKLQSKLEKLNRFKPSDDIASDFNNLLRLIEKDNLYRKVNANEDPRVIFC